MDTNNGLIMCKEHAIDYINKAFQFDCRGYIINFDKAKYNGKIHISQRFLNEKRKEYISKSNIMEG